MDTPIASSGGNVRHCLQSLFRNVGRQAEWGIALRDMVSAFMTNDAGAQRTLFSGGVVAPPVGSLEGVRKKA